ncbi:hypothetical protein, partial [Rhodopirellula baltica]|uniref:hypothetical protein n=1 Tax=Rhodopirellula baltica TaxID=265606 RepID=UPI001F39325F
RILASRHVPRRDALNDENDHGSRYSIRQWRRIAWSQDEFDWCCEPVGESVPDGRCEPSIIAEVTPNRLARAKLGPIDKAASSMRSNLVVYAAIPGDSLF